MSTVLIFGLRSEAMAKVDWNEFVDSHKSGHGVGIRSLLKLKILDAEG
jgi:hypothetical protein